MSNTSEHWLRLVVLTSTPEPVTDRLLEFGALGFEIQDGDTYMDDGSIEPVPPGMTRVIAFFPADQPPDTLEKTLQEALSLETLQVTDYNDVSWRTAWQSFFRPLRLSRRSVVGPPWESLSPPTEWTDPESGRVIPVADGIVIPINPGLAFGTGTHETTQLVATLIDDLLFRNASAIDSMLDVGTGSGILSFLARGLGVPSVVAIDNDPEAIRVATETAADFQTTNLHFATTPARDLEGVFPLVVANILEPILLSLKEDLRRLTAPGGYLVMSGVLNERAGFFAEAFAHDDWTLLKRDSKNEWASFLFQHSL